MADFKPILFKAPEPVGLSRDDIEALAEGVTAKMNVNYDDFYWFENLITNMGGRIDVAAGNASGLMIEVLGNGDFTLYSSPLGSLTNDRALLATSLGHYVLHAPAALEDDPGYGLRSPFHPDHPHAPPREARYEAIEFASGLLMPEAAFSATWVEGGPAACQKKFNTLRNWTMSRARRLNLLADEAEPELAP
ncbi:ImmA/IrrE family metallo-endopeptidase [Epibacterium sp. DP7N7-1]|nr:ImmA/IrrE family metallo-endopeptidase [Epibacterium sp. DP7N7-1]